MWVTKQLLVAIDWHFIYHSMEVNSYQQLSVTNILQNFIFCDQQKKETCTGLEQTEYIWTFQLIFIFGRTITFKSMSKKNQSAVWFELISCLQLK